MKWSTELKILFALIVLVVMYLVYRKLADAAKKVADEFDPHGSGIGNAVASSLDADIAPAGGISLNDAISSGVIADPAHPPWWVSSAGALGFTVPYSWWSTP